MHAPDLFLASTPRANQDLLRQRLPYLVDATGEDFRAGRGSLPLELLRAGFVEWAGIKARSDAFAREGPASLDEGYSYLPVVLCRERRSLRQALACDMRSGLLVIGTPACASGTASGARVQWPVDAPDNIEMSATAWFGAPEHVVGGQDFWKLPLSCDTRSLSADTIASRLHQVEGLWLRCGVSQGFVLLNLDGMRSLSERRDAVADEVFAAALAWAQCGFHEATVIIHGEGMACAQGQKAMGQVARHLGRALSRRG
ncbi:hypothetical protein J2X20_002937 [Pelomonas saccharophila]|uniref:DUF3846 domain-containing protein n=1 Tax=Roseateles saccharophilus TaxID=304 RepID=A0ABU1YN43_ROSSA|nr:hypothetical protein [Roseateles saccharophilus]MDR7270279.1 hypothetical protein [Roseateles saccharophilus]